MRRRQGLLGVITLGRELQLRSLGRGQRHEAHEALGVHVLHPVVDDDLALELVGHLHQFGRGPQMEPQLVDDGQVFACFHDIPFMGG